MLTMTQSSIPNPIQGSHGHAALCLGVLGLQSIRQPDRSGCYRVEVLHCLHHLARIRVSLHVFVSEPSHGLIPTGSHTCTSSSWKQKARTVTNCLSKRSLPCSMATTSRRTSSNRQRLQFWRSLKRPISPTWNPVSAVMTMSMLPRSREWTIESSLFCTIAGRNASQKRLCIYLSILLCTVASTFYLTPREGIADRLLISREAWIHIYKIDLR